MTPLAGYDALRACVPHTTYNSPRKRGVTRYALVDPNPQGACRPLSLRRFAPCRTRTPWANLRFPPLRGSPFPCAFGAVYKKKSVGAMEQATSRMHIAAIPAT